MKYCMRAAAVLIPVALAASAFAPAPASARELSDQEVLDLLTVEQPRDRAIRRALAWLRAQQRDDGSVVVNQFATAKTSLAIMAHLAAGHTFDDPEHGAWLRKSLGYVLGTQDKTGYFGSRDNSRMYGHGITTLMLAEALGMLQDEDLEESVCAALRRAVSVTVNAARVPKGGHHKGGWRYQPTDGNSDLSLSGWQLMSLHAAQQVGITVPEEVVTNAVVYAKGLADTDGKVGYENRGQDNPSLRGLAMLCYAIGREEDDEMVTRIAQRIQRDPIDWRGPWFYYRAYYDSVGMSRARPEKWEEYSPRLEAALLGHQRDDGSWPSPPGDNEMSYGPVYVTSMAVLALTVDRHVLPAYQR